MILAVDIEGFGSATRGDLLLARLRQRLHQLVDDTLENAGVAPHQVLLHRDLGDGLLVLLDPAVPVSRLLTRGIGRLAGRLARDNERSMSPAARLRLRVAVHRGPLVRDAYGYTGRALTHAFRLLDAEVVRTALAGVRAGMVVVLSERIYQDLRGDSNHGHGDVVLTGYQPVWMAHKETTTRGWLHLSEMRDQPQFAGLLRAADAMTATAPRVDKGDRVRRRELLAFSGTLMGSATLELLVGERRPSGEDVLVAQRIARRLHRLDESLPVAHVDAARMHHAAAVHRLARRAQTPRVRAGLLQALAHVQAVSGVMAATDLRDRRRSSRRFRVALQAAGEVENPVLSGMVCLRMSEAALAIERPAEALELAGAGSQLVSDADPALYATLQLAVANAHAAAGSAAAALRAADAGEELVMDQGLPPSTWTRVYAARFAGGRGMVEATLGRWEQAAEGLLSGIAAYPPGNGLRGVLLAHLARVRFAQEDPEQAAALTLEALPIVMRLGSPSRLATLQPLQPWLVRYQHVQAVAELADRYRQVLWSPASLAWPATSRSLRGEDRPWGAEAPVQSRRCL